MGGGNLSEEGHAIEKGKQFEKSYEI